MYMEMLFILQCMDPDCGFRSCVLIKPVFNSCPRCGHTVEIIEYTQKYVTLKPTPVDHKKPRIIILLDNIRSIYNVGAIFRTADGAGIDLLLLAGTTPTPDHPRISKTGLGSEWSVKWEYHRNGLEIVQQYKKLGFLLYALERTEDSINLFEMKSLNNKQALLLVVGNEATGVDPEILALVDQKIHLPMTGYKRSLNVATATGIAIYYLRFVLLQS